MICVLGFWRLKDLEDPWTARPDTPRPPSTTPPQTPTLPSSPRKRGWKTTSDEEQEEEVIQTIQKKLCTPPTSPRPSITPESIPSSPVASPLSHLKSSDELEKEVAILREQLHHMTESIAQLSTDALIPDQPVTPTNQVAEQTNDQQPNAQQSATPFSFHNRVWEESYSFPQQHQIGSVQA